MCSALFFLSSCSSLIPVQDVCGGQLLEGWGNMLTAAVYQLATRDVISYPV